MRFTDCELGGDWLEEMDALHQWLEEHGEEVGDEPTEGGEG